MVDWLRLWHEMPTDPKWRVIAKKSGRSIAEVISVYVFTLVNASANATERGRTHNLFADDIAAALDIEEAAVESILAAMEGKVIEKGKLSGWESRQPKREDNSASRAKEWREKQKAERNRTQENAEERPEKIQSIKKQAKKISNLEALTLEMNSSWLESKRAEGKYLKHDPAQILEIFRNYCLSKGKTYADYLAAYRNAFDWERCQPKTPEAKGQGRGRITL